MTPFQKSENEKFFKIMISRINEGGLYIWPDAKETFTVTGGKLKAHTPRGLKKIKDITSPGFHKTCLA
jgi:hypothetical protein